MRFKNKLLLYSLLIIGLTITIFYIVQSIKSYKQFSYLKQNGLTSGTASVEAIKPWMTMQFISTAYAVPQEYLFEQLGQNYDEKDAKHSLKDLNQKYKLGYNQSIDQLGIIVEIQKAITGYKQNPVTYNIKKIEPWMSLMYISNTLGIKIDLLIEGMSLKNTQDYKVKPLDVLAKDTKYKGGPKKLIEDIEVNINNQNAE